jgi:uncharacterized protein YdeI (YjbR/CyaY-like superfamily)
MNLEPKYFASPAELRAWLEKHHTEHTELLVGFHKKSSGRPSITWPEAVDEALCVGWIDGIRRSVDDERYTIRFTPRKPASTWSAVNCRRMAALTAEGRVKPAGLAAFDRRKPEKSGTYSYENRHAATLGEAEEKTFRAARRAWSYFEKQPPGYRHTVTWWVVSAKRPETRVRRLEKLIEHCNAGEWIPAMRPIRKKY